MLRRLYDWTLEKAAHPHAQWWLAAFSFMEASFFPVPPHPLLGLMCLAEPHKAVRFSMVAMLASVAGGLLGYAIGHFAYEAFGQAMLSALGLAEGFPKAACFLREHGALFIVAKGATPIPFKLLTLTAGFIGMSLVPFLLASLVSRSISFLIVGGLFRLYGARIKPVIDKHLGKVTLAFVAFIVSGFLLFSLIEGGGDQSACAQATALS